jgi:hypothetical protein
MNKLKANGFLVGMALAGVVLVVFAALMIFPAWSEADKLRTTINRTLASKLRDVKVAGDPDIRAYQEYRGALVGSYKSITDFYKGTNTYLERWLPGVPEDPPRDSFIARYQEEIEKIEKAVKEKGTAIGVGEPVRFGFNWEKPQVGDWGQVMQFGGAAEEKRVLRELQKRFWARQRVANAIVNGGVKVTRVHDFRFFKKLHDRIQGPEWEQSPQGPNVVLYQGVGANPQGGPPQNFTEFDLPGELGKTMTYGFALQLPYSEVPKVLREILNPANESKPDQRLLVNIIGTHVTIRNQHEPEVTITYEQGKQDVKQAKIDEIKAKTKPLDVLLSVTCQIIDFEPAKVKDFSGEAPQGP